MVARAYKSEKGEVVFYLSDVYLSERLVRDIFIGVSVSTTEAVYSVNYQYSKLKACPLEDCANVPDYGHIFKSEINGCLSFWARTSANYWCIASENSEMIGKALLRHATGFSGIDTGVGVFFIQSNIKELCSY